MRCNSSKFGLFLAGACLSLPLFLATLCTSYASPSADCIKDYTALKKKSDVRQAKTKKHKLPVEQKDSPLLVKAQECVKIARAEAKSFLAKPFTTRYSYKREKFSDACELARDGADILCRVVPAYRQCVQHFSYSPKQCQKLNGKTAQPCCRLKRT